VLVLLVAAGLGALVGWNGLVPDYWQSYIPRWSRGFLLLMLFALGAKLGASTEVHSHLPALGLKALVISLATMLGSILAAVIIAPILGDHASEPDTALPMDSTSG